MADDAHAPPETFSGAAQGLCVQETVIAVQLLLLLVSVLPWAIVLQRRWARQVSETVAITHV